MENQVIPQRDTPFKSQEQAVRVLMYVSMAVLGYLLVNFVQFQVFDFGNIAAGILSFVWEFGVIPIVLFVVFCLVYWIDNNTM